MPPRSRPLPVASTASAKLARAAFYCDLCGKQYTRQNELEAHESSYDHLHKKRLKEMKSLQGKMAPRKEKDGAGGGVMSIKLGSGKKEGGAGGHGGGTGSAGGGFKKGGFKNAFAEAEGDVEVKEERETGGREDREGIEDAQMKEVDSDVTDEEDYYDPRRPTGCMPGCPGRDAGEKRGSTKCD